MNQSETDLSAPTDWKIYLFIAAKFLAIFYIATFCLIAFFIHRGDVWVIKGIILATIYAFILIYSFAKLIKQLPMPAILLAAPTIPLVMLILVVSMIPLFNLLNHII